MLRIVSLALIVVIGGGPVYYGGYVNAGCKIYLNDDLPTKEPLYLTRKNSRLDFVYPHHNGKTLLKKDRGVFELAVNEEIIMACPGKSNKLSRGQGPASVIARPHCVKGTKFALGAKDNYNIKQLECFRSVKGNLQTFFQKRCGYNKLGTKMEIGFEVEHEFLTLITLCHDVRAGDTLYVEHDIPATIDGARTFTARPDFEDGAPDLYQDIRLKEAYSRAYQGRLFDRLLGDGMGDKLIEGTYYLARGHLAPDGDFLYGTWQWSTYFYVNTAPQWQIINAGHWLALERYIRKVAEQTREDLHVMTGTHGILKLNSSQDKRIEIQLVPEGRKLKVPAVFFKVIRSKSSNASIVAVCSNNPFESTRAYCDNIASANHWPTTWENDFSKGQIYFCDVDDFIRKTGIVIPDIKYSGILQGVEKKKGKGSTRPREDGV